MILMKDWHTWSLIMLNTVFGTLIFDTGGYIKEKLTSIILRKFCLLFDPLVLKGTFIYETITC